MHHPFFMRPLKRAFAGDGFLAERSANGVDLIRDQTCLCTGNAPMRQHQHALAALYRPFNKLVATTVLPPPVGNV
jgi:hypothetical protein